ncbi:Kelch repeat-containing protein [Niabella ginsenosidivorans]|nr:kelch repeat-containing protein [Niabella ginsenosidivorans]
MKWNIAGQLPAVKNEKKSLGYAGPVAGIIGDQLIVGGGANFPDGMPWKGGKKKYYDHLFAFEIRGDSLLADERSVVLPFNLAYAACTSFSQGIFIGGGENETGISRNAMLLKKHRDSLMFYKLPELPAAVTNAAATCVEDIIYIAGGEMKDRVSNACYSLDIRALNKGWQQLPHLPYAASHGVMVGSNRALYYIGGREKGADGISALYKDVYAFDLVKKEWKSLQSLPYPLAAGTGAMINENEIVLFGGDKGERFHETELKIQQINNEPDTQKQHILNVERMRLQETHPGFSNQVLVLNIAENKWSVKGIIPFKVPVTTTAVATPGAIYIPSGEIKAGVRTPEILRVAIKH